MASNAVHVLARGLAKALRPPDKLSYSQWAAENFRLSKASSSAPGRFRPWKYQRGILDAIGDPTIERVSVIKSARTGYTVGLVAAIGAIAVNDPCPIILLMPTDDDARGIAVDEIDPAFRESPALREIMRIGRFDGRNTLTQRSMQGGGSLKILSARAPRNLRRHTAKVLLADEVDGMEITNEGDPIKLAEKRTTSFADRKIVIGSTPTDEAKSIVLKRYDESDQRIFEVPCIHCDTPFEMLWQHIDWPRGEPEKAVCICPHCGSEIEERYKPQMVEDGEWRAMRPEVKNHAGFRLNALVSQFANASWAKLAEEYEKAVKNGPSDMQVFYNTVLGRVWSTAINYVSANELLTRLEDFGLDWDHEANQWREDIPEAVAYITAGVDVQPDRLEVVFIGHSPDNRYILGHYVIRGNATLQSTWDELDALLSTRWKHPLGGEIGVEAACVDSGDGNMTQRVYDFCECTMARRIVAIKGQAGPHPVLRASRNKRRNRTATLYIVGVDTVKTDILVNLPLEKGDQQSFRYSNTLQPEWFDQFTSERREIKYVKGRPVISFERIGKKRAEALDCTVYALAAKNLCRFEYEKRYEQLKGSNASARPSLRELSKRLHG